MSEILVPDGALTFPETASDEELLEGVLMWVDLLAEARFDDAFKLTAHDNHFSWTPDLIGSIIAGYGLPHEPGNHEFSVSKISQTKEGFLPRWDVQRWQNAEPGGRIGFIEFDLPLDGEWSDLTATFEVLKINDQMVLVLNEIHVL